MRFATGAGGSAVVPTFSPLRVEGSIRHPEVGEAWEYAVMISIADDSGKEVTRQIVGVGAIQPGEERKFTFAVEVFTPEAEPEPEPASKLADGGRPALSSAQRTR